jgi:FeS assembly SUF system regulator
MIRLSRLADYGVALAGRMASSPERSFNAFDLAEAAGLPAPTVSKILALLARGGVLLSQRGAKGGYRLARGPSEISLAEIIGALDGPIALTLCLEQGDGACDVEQLCPSRRGWHSINDAIRKAFEDVSLAEMCGPRMFIEPLAAPTPGAEARG